MTTDRDSLGRSPVFKKPDPVALKIAQWLAFLAACGGLAVSLMRWGSTLMSAAWPALIVLVAICLVMWTLEKLIR
jgi:hypothetical protein